MASTQSLPRHAAIAQALREQIRSGELTPGAPLPSEARLTSRFAVSRGTVRQALAALRAEGLIAGGRGRVPVVRRAGLAQNFDQLVSFSLWARQLGRVPSARTLDLTAVPPTPRPPSSWRSSRARRSSPTRACALLDGDPVLVERAAFLEPVGRLLLDCDLDGGLGL